MTAHAGRIQPLRYADLSSSVTSSLPPLPIADMRAPVLSRLPKPLGEARIILVGSAGVHLADEPPFQPVNDLSFRRIPSDIPPERLRVSHPAPVRGPGAEDVNTVFPYLRLNELAQSGVIGGTTDHHLSILGAIKQLTELVTDLAPRMVDDARSAGADAALLVPL